MTVTVLHDTLTDTAGTAWNSHVPEVGGSWGAFGGGLDGSAAPQIFSDGSVGNTSNATTYTFRTNTATNTADGETIAIQTVRSTALGCKVVLGLRGNGSGNGYVALMDNSGGGHAIYRTIAGASTMLGTTFSADLSAGPLIEMVVSGSGATVTIEIKVAGSVVATRSDTHASRITTYGRPIAGCYNLTSAFAGLRITEITVTNVDPPVTDTITTTSPVADLVVQRSGGVGTVSVSGTYTGTPTTIERRVVLSGTATVVSGFDWATAVASPAAGIYTFTVPSIPSARQWYQVQVRFSNATGVTATSAAFGVGHTVALTGQSSAERMFTTGGGDAAGAYVRMSGITPAGWTTPTGAGAKRLGNTLATAMDCVIGLVYAAWGGTSITGWRVNELPTPNGAQFNLSLPYLQSAGLVIGDMAFVQGEMDWDTMDYATYGGHLPFVADGYRTTLGRAGMPFHLVGLAATTSTPRSTYDQVKRAQYDYANGTANTYWVDRTDAELVDGLHHTAAGYSTIADRLAQSVLKANGVAAQSRGPAVQSIVQVDATHYDVTVVHRMGTDITPGTGGTGFTAVDPGAGGAAIAVTEAVRQSTTVLRLTLASAPVGTPVFSYLLTGSPNLTAPVRDNSALALPLEYLYSMAASAGAVNLTVSGLSAAPALASLALTQTHQLSVAGLSSATTLASLALTQTHQLSVAGLSSAPALSIVNLTSGPAVDLVASSLSPATTLASLALTQAHQLSAAGVSNAPTLASLALTQAHQLTVSGLSSARTLSSPRIVYTPEGGSLLPPWVRRKITVGARRIVRG